MKNRSDTEASSPSDPSNPEFWTYPPTPSVEDLVEVILNLTRRVEILEESLREGKQ